MHAVTTLLSNFVTACSVATYYKYKYAAAAGAETAVRGGGAAIVCKDDYTATSHRARPRLERHAGGGCRWQQREIQQHAFSILNETWV